MTESIVYQTSTGNVFADLGLPEPEELRAKAELVRQIGVLIRHANMTQVQAAAVFGIDQPKVSALLSGSLRGFSMDRLLRFLTLLGQDVEIRITPRSNAGGPTRIRVASAVPVDETKDGREAATVASAGPTDRRAP